MITSPHSQPRRVLIGTKFAKDEEIKHPMTIDNTEIQEIEDDDAEITWMKAPNTKLWSEESGLPISKRQAMKEKDERVRRNNQIRMDLTGSYMHQTHQGV